MHDRWSPARGSTSPGAAARVRGTTGEGAVALPSPSWKLYWFRARECAALRSAHSVTRRLSIRSMDVGGATMRSPVTTFLELESDVTGARSMGKYTGARPAPSRDEIARLA